MRKPEFSFLTTKEIKPEGWLRRQLEIQAEGSSGHLDLIWPDIRGVPYWLDGFIPLACRSRRVEKLEYIRDGVERKAPYCDYEMSPVSDWNYGFCSDELELIQGEIGEYPFSVEHPPVRLRTKMAKVLWKEKNGICAVVPEGRTALGEAEDKELQPYGCTNLRMTEMPWVHK